MDKKIKFGDNVSQWNDGENFYVTLCVTEDCNMACTYCYMKHKNNVKRMTYETGKKIIDFVLETSNQRDEQSIVIEFIGGEPLLEIKLISQLCDYFVGRLYTMQHPWFYNYRFSFSSNGLLYNNVEVQKFIKRHVGHISFGISVDGTKEKQDLSRKTKNGQGTYDALQKVIPLWLQQFPNSSTKATFSHDDLKYLKESIIHLWHIGIRNVMANIVYEDVWTPEDICVFEEQLNALGDYVIENNLWESYSVRFFNPIVGLPLEQGHLNSNICGSGKTMMAFDTQGNIYPCIRFLDFCIDKEGKKIGDYNTGIDNNKIRPFKMLTLNQVLDGECKNCDIASGCYFCCGNNYNESKTASIFERTKHNCQMHKANVRANNRFWYLLSQKLRTTSRIADLKVERPVKCLKYLYIITSDDIPPMCGYANKMSSRDDISLSVAEKALDLCYRYHLIPVFLGSPVGTMDLSTSTYYIISPERKKQNSKIDVEIARDWADLEGRRGIVSLTLNRYNLREQFDLRGVSTECYRLNLFFSDIEEWTDEDYVLLEIFLSHLKVFYEERNHSSKLLSVNLLDDSELTSCNCGLEAITVAPDGNIYICPAFYFEQKGAIGSIETVEDTMEYLKRIGDCHCCQNCLFQNSIGTGEIRVKSYNQERYRRLINQFRQTDAGYSN